MLDAVASEFLPGAGDRWFGKLKEAGFDRRIGEGLLELPGRFEEFGLADFVASAVADQQDAGLRGNGSPEILWERGHAIYFSHQRRDNHGALLRLRVYWECWESAAAY